MCINFNGYHSGGSSFVNVNECWLLQKSFVHHRYKFSFEKKKKSPSIWFHTPKPVRIRQSGRTGIGGVTSIPREDTVILWLGGGGGGGEGELASEVAFILLLFCFILVVLVLSTAYLSCIGLFCMYVLANSRQ